MRLLGQIVVYLISKKNHLSTEIEIVKSAKAFAIIDSIHKLDGGVFG